ncbi:MAG: riboflavin synthase [Deltaproteobacteria bacterium]|nr:riboflavin synthase [Deltaproteobacteria bacterium]
MFTGIIEGLGTITGVRRAGESKVITVNAGFNLSGSKIGDSIAVNGACLTAVSIDGPIFSVDASPETLLVSTLDRVGVGDRINIERALRLSDRLDGHLVSGHVDGQGKIVSKKDLGRTLVVRIDVPEILLRHMIKKGSVAVDGISLTINELDRSGFSVAVIPHTAKVTTIGLKKPGDTVNLETDIIGKYIERFLLYGKDSKKEPSSRRIDMEFLAGTGFL